MESPKPGPFQGSCLPPEPNSKPIKGEASQIPRCLANHSKADTQETCSLETTNADEVKVNYDGAIFSEEGRAGLRVVIRNSEGAVIASLSQQIPLPTTIIPVEALAVRRVATFAKEIGIMAAVLKGDSDIVYKDLISLDLSLALHGHIIHDVKQLTTLLTSLRFAHVCRQGNRVAHTLARRASSSPNLNVWMENVALDILHVVQADLAAQV